MEKPRISVRDIDLRWTEIIICPNCECASIFACSINSGECNSCQTIFSARYVRKMTKMYMHVYAYRPNRETRTNDNWDWFMKFFIGSDVGWVHRGGESPAETNKIMNEKWGSYQVAEVLSL